MRILFGLLSVFFLLLPLLGETFTLKSWNVKRLSLNSLKKRDLAFREYINEPFDITTLQEIMDYDVVSKITDKKIILSKKLGRGKYKEHIAFIVGNKYRDSSLKLYQYYDSHDSFERDPVMLLIDKKIGIVSVHLIYGRKSSLKYTHSGKTFSKREARALSNVFKYFSKKAKIPEKNIVIVGDFNLSYSDLQNIFHDKYNVYIQKPTTVSTSFNRIGKSSYDHLCYKNTFVKGMVDYDVLEYTGGRSIQSRKTFRKTMSDHYPIIFKISIE